MTDQQIYDAIGKQAALAGMCALLAKFSVLRPARAEYFNGVCHQFITHTLKLIATHKDALERHGHRVNSISRN